MSDLRNRRILKQFEQLKSDNDTEWFVELHYPNDLTRWRLYLSGRDGTPYEKGQFQLSITFPLEYPIKCPLIQFDTKIFHPNVDEYGRTCIISEVSNYVASISMRDLLRIFISDIYRPTTGLSAKSLAAFLYDSDQKLFQQQAAEWTRRYAMDDEIISNWSCSHPSSPAVSRGSCTNHFMECDCAMEFVFITEFVSKQFSKPIEGMQSLLISMVVSIN